MPQSKSRGASQVLASTMHHRHRGRNQCRHVEANQEIAARPAAVPSTIASDGARSDWCASPVQSGGDRPDRAGDEGTGEIQQFGQDSSCAAAHSSQASAPRPTTTQRARDAVPQRLPQVANADDRYPATRSLVAASKESRLEANAENTTMKTSTAPAVPEQFGRDQRADHVLLPARSDPAPVPPAQ